MNWGQDRGAEVVEKRGRPRSGGVEVCVRALVMSAPVLGVRWLCVREIVVCR